MIPPSSSNHRTSLRLPGIAELVFRSLHECIFSEAHHYEFVVMSFGLTTFMELMNRVFKPYLDIIVIVFIDYIFFHSMSKADHVQHLRIVFQRWREEKLYAKFSKCEFSHESVVFLEHIVTKDDFMVDPVKVQAVHE